MDFTIIYMVAGLSSRFGGKIKGLMRVGPNNESLLEYSISQALPAGFNKIIFIVSKETEKPIRKEFGDSYKGVPIQYAFQRTNSKERDKPWGTTDAVCATREIIDSNFVVCNGDDIYGREAFQTLADHFKTKNNCATIGYKLGKVIPEQGAVNRAIFQTNLEDKIETIKETCQKESSKEKTCQKKTCQKKEIVLFFFIFFYFYSLANSFLIFSSSSGFVIPKH